MSVGLSSLSNTCFARFVLVLPTALVGTFSFYDVWGSLDMIIPGISIARFAALPASSFLLISMHAGNLHDVICFPWFY